MMLGFLNRLSGEVSIQMVTALVLQLIQCSVKIPDKADDISEATGAKDGGDEKKSQVSLQKKKNSNCHCQPVMFGKLHVHLHDYAALCIQQWQVIASLKELILDCVGVYLY